MKHRHILIVGLVLGLAIAAFGSNHPFIIDEGTLLGNFENISDWTIDGTGGSQEADTVNFREGTQALKLNSVNGMAAWSTKTICIDLSSATNFIFWIYISNKADLYSITIYFSSTTNFSKYFSKAIFGASFQTGWNRIVLSKGALDVTGDECWANTMIKLRVRCWANTGKNVSVSFDDFRYNHIAKAKVVISFDDGWDNQIIKAFPILHKNNQKAVVFINSGKIGYPDYMTLANLVTLRDAGWDISNHTSHHADSTTIPQEEMEAQIDDCYDWLVDNGFGVTAKYFAYPNGTYNDAVITKLKERHKLARSTMTAFYQPHLLLEDDIEYLIKSSPVVNTHKVTTIEGWIDNVIITGGFLPFHFHKIVDSNADESTKYLTADFQTISDYLKTKQDSGLLEVITFSDYYNALSGLEPFCLRKPAMDFNGDCKVDFIDLAIFSQSWLECNLKPKSACWE
jgi:peptidoglycan/xylan/chitin deacetylase (PgdA/CDA1 family)